MAPPSKGGHPSGAMDKHASAPIDASEKKKKKKKKKSTLNKLGIVQRTAREQSTELPSVGGVIKSRRMARKYTSQFHNLLNQLQDLDNAEFTSKAERTETKSKILAEMEAMGGRKAYQEASVVSTEHFRSSKYVFQQLTVLGLRPKKGEPKLKVLEVGAINLQLKNTPWLDVRAIDLLSRTPKIEEIDFFKIVPKEEYDCVVNFMVINCVQLPSARGDMLVKCRQHLRPGGHLFLALPLLCLTRSPYMSMDLFRKTLLQQALGFQLVHEKSTPKVAFFCFRWDGSDAHVSAKALARFSDPPQLLRGNGNQPRPLNASKVRDFAVTLTK